MDLEEEFQSLYQPFVTSKAKKSFFIPKSIAYSPTFLHYFLSPWNSVNPRYIKSARLNALNDPFRNLGLGPLHFDSETEFFKYIAIRVLLVLLKSPLDVAETMLQVQDEMAEDGDKMDSFGRESELNVNIPPSSQLFPQINPPFGRASKCDMDQWQEETLPPVNPTDGLMDVKTGDVKFITETALEDEQTIEQDSWLDDFREKSYFSNDVTPIDEENRPPLKGGIIEAVRYICEHEGWASLWKGAFIGCIQEVLSFLLQRPLEIFLNDTFGFAFGFHPITALSSRVLVGLLLTPMELIRIRLMVQSSQRPYCSSSLDCFRSIVMEEGYTTLYSKKFLLPTILHHTVPFTIKYISNLVIRDYLSVSPFWEPFSYRCWEMGFGLLELLVKLPIETIRRRLMSQIVIQVEVDEEEEEEYDREAYGTKSQSNKGFDEVSVRSEGMGNSVIMRYRTVWREKVIRSRDTAVKTSNIVYQDFSDCFRKVIIEGYRARGLEWAQKKGYSTFMSESTMARKPMQPQGKRIPLKRKGSLSESGGKNIWIGGDRLSSSFQGSGRGWAKDDLVSHRSFGSSGGGLRYKKDQRTDSSEALDWGSVVPWLGIPNLYKGFGTYLGGHLLFVGMKEDDE